MIDGEEQESVEYKAASPRSQTWAWGLRLWDRRDHTLPTARRGWQSAVLCSAAQIGVHRYTEQHASHHIKILGAAALRRDCGHLGATVAGPRLRRPLRCQLGTLPASAPAVNVLQQEDAAS